jgi:hypothetical protein
MVRYQGDRHKQKPKNKYKENRRPVGRIVFVKIKPAFRANVAQCKGKAGPIEIPFAASGAFTAPAEFQNFYIRGHN